MMIITDTDNIVFSEGIIEIYKDKYKYGTFCLKATISGGGARNIVSNISRREVDEAEKALIKAYAEGRQVINFSKKIKDELSREEAERTIQEESA